jgi:uncharacterized protein YciI
MKHFLLFYEYVPDYMEKRGALRPLHFAHARAATERGEHVLGGACTDEGPPIAVLLFKAPSREVVETFARNDPYVTQGLVTAWRIREWTTVMGAEALTKVNV